jgi:heterogeneous nuclear ribonucleoprotein R
MKKPPHSSEVFLGGIPRTLTQEELEELCAPAGEIFATRLLKDISTGQNRGYAFVTFKTREAAAKAIEIVNGAQLREDLLLYSLFRKRT